MDFSLLKGSLKFIFCYIKHTHAHRRDDSRWDLCKLQTHTIYRLPCLRKSSRQRDELERLELGTPSGTLGTEAEYWEVRILGG